MRKGMFFFGLLWFWALALLVTWDKDTVEAQSFSFDSSGNIKWETTATGNPYDGMHFQTIGWNFTVTNGKRMGSYTYYIGTAASKGTDKKGRSYASVTSGITSETFETYNVRYKLDLKTLERYTGVDVHQGSVVITANAILEFYNRSGNTKQSKKIVDSKSEANACCKSYGFSSNFSGNYAGYFDQKVEQNYYYLKVSKGTGVSSATGDGWYRKGVSVTVRATIKDGFKWKNWTGYRTSVNQSVTFSMPAKNIHMTANGEYIIYEITVDANGGTVTQGSEMKFRKILEKYNNSWGYYNFSGGRSYWAGTKPETGYRGSRTGYQLEGYYTQKTGGTKVMDADGKLLVAPNYFKQNATIYARWIENTVKVYFYKNDGTSASFTKTYSYSQGGTVSFSNPWTRSGYTAMGWAKSAGAAKPEYTCTSTVWRFWINENAGQTVRLYMIWEAVQQSVAYEMVYHERWDDATEDYVVTITQNDHITILGQTDLGPKFAENKRTFLGWVLYRESDQRYYYRKEENYGWQSSYGVTKESQLVQDRAVLEPLTTQNGDTIHVYAQWQYTVCISMGQGTGLKLSLEYPEGVEYTGELKREFCTFTNPNLYRTTGDSDYYLGRLLLASDYDKNRYLSEYRENPESDACLQLRRSRIHTLPSAKGYRFIGFAFTDGDYSGNIQSRITGYVMGLCLQYSQIRSDLRMEAVYEKLPEVDAYEIVFDSDGGSDPDPASYQISYGVELPDVSPVNKQVRVTFCFDGNGQEDEVFHVPQIFTGYYLDPKDPATRYYDADGRARQVDGSPRCWDREQSAVLIAGWNVSSLMTPVPREKEGYLFAGWYTEDGEFAANGGDEFTPLEDITLYARWGVSQVTMSFDSKGGIPRGEEIEPVDICYQQELPSKVVLPQKYVTVRLYEVYPKGTEDHVRFWKEERIANDFYGWFLDLNNADSALYDYRAQIVAGKEKSTFLADFVLYAGWSEGVSLSLPQMTAEGYRWKGWYEDPEGKKILGDAGEDVYFEEDCCIYGCWESLEDTGVPVIEAQDRYFTLGQAQSGYITKEELLRNCKAYDSGGVEVVHGTYADSVFELINFTEEEFRSLTGSAAVLETFYVRDSYGKEARKSIWVYVSDEKNEQEIQLPRLRFISLDYLDKETGEGGLRPDSIWREEENYLLLKKLLSEEQESD